MMNEKRLEFFKNLLNERLDSLIREAESGVGELVSEKENLPDSIDLASYESEGDPECMFFACTFNSVIW